MPPDAAPPRLRVAVDVGGTFTDVVGFDEATGELRFGKPLSTHDGLARGIADTLDAASVRVADAHLLTRICSRMARRLPSTRCRSARARAPRC